MGRMSSEELQESLDEAFDLVEHHEDDEAIAADPEPMPAPRVATTDVAPVKISAIPQYIGLLLIVAAFGLAALPFVPGIKESMLTRFADIGLTPGLMFLAGVLLSGLAWLQSTGLRNSMHALQAHVRDDLSEIRHEVESIAEEARRTDQAQVIGDSLGELERGLTKQDGMISNLTKAVRMHNKPLVDIVGMATEMQQSIKGHEEKLLSVKLDLEAIEKAVCESLSSAEKRWEGMFERLHSSESSIEDRLLATREALASRLEPFIEKNNKQLAEELETQWDLLREAIEKSLDQLESQTRDEIRGVAEKISSGGESPSFGKLEQNLAALQRSVEQFGRQAVASAAAPSAASAPAAASSEAKTAATTAAPSSAASAAPSAPAPSAGDAAEGGGGKNVMSAIERLKKMRGN